MCSNFSRFATFLLMLRFLDFHCFGNEHKFSSLITILSLEILTTHDSYDFAHFLKIKFGTK